ncbi:hypothetical protein [Echinimonas agarilytica]|uniref:Uncharacterized protein n=1 Tax=Echinimonas agarilytica TaxID=1215918 RepID=A0AA42B6C5_9GAMM|nr:hypothetical protein [Echinimonas agarilytica]MCM2678281.1 hypothetical protein [Echinimonas agarilytica]
MTKLEAFRLLRANSKYEAVSDNVLKSLLGCISDHDQQMFSEQDLLGIKSHLIDFIQYYECDR